MKPLPAPSLLYPGDKFFRAHPHLEPTYDKAGRYTGARERVIQRPLEIEGLRHA
ncbi:MAG TPA: hypothetical protein VHB45_14275 [Alloacidobacterium sp.]|nr:hypothetical protein [Alloacidobacterium sp.]